MDIEKNKLLIDLYKHEDNLLWIKVKFTLLFNSGLLLAWKFLVVDGFSLSANTGEFLAIFGFVCNLFFAITLHGSTRHIEAYRNAWSEYVFPLDGPKFAGKSPFGLCTSSVIIALAILVSLIWLFIFSLSLFEIPIVDKISN